MPETVVLVSPDGREYSSSSRAEITRLRAHGYKTKPAAKTAAAKPVDKK